MIWQTHENQGIALLDEPMAEQLSSYLENKESQLSSHLVGAIHFLPGAPPSLELSTYAIVRLNTAVEEFGKRINRISEIKRQAVATNDWELAAKEINRALWEYVEVLEGCVTELFQQMDQIGFEQWNVDLSATVTSIKDELTHRMDDLIWAVRRLEQQLQRYKRVCESQPETWSAIRNLSSFWRSLLDRSIEPTVRKCQKFLNFRYRRFIERYTGYLQLYESAEKSLRKFYGFRVLSSMELNFQDKYKQFYMLLKIWELNQSSKTLPAVETARALRTIVSSEGVQMLFRDYLIAIRTAIFDKSRLIKKEFRVVFNDQQTRQPIIDNLLNYREELVLLQTTIDSYQKYLDKNDFESSHHAHSGFSSWFKKTESKQTKQLSILSHQINQLEDLCSKFYISLQSEHALEPKLTAHVEDEINQHLHEMGQPLASYDLMKRHAKGLLHHLEALDEIGSFYPETVEKVCRTLCKSMCIDWKYHVLQHMPLFHQIYDTHIQIVGPLEDRQHLNRLNKFKRILEQLDHWANHHETLKHTHEIELDINDLKAYFQDFLAYVQRLDQCEESIKQETLSKTHQALLEYLYVFGRFFYKLHLEEQEDRLLRKQLLFIDQYFEAIESKLQEHIFS